MTDMPVKTCPRYKRQHVRKRNLCVQCQSADNKKAARVRNRLNKLWPARSKFRETLPPAT